jgi:hypothetical protein
MVEFYNFIDGKFSILYLNINSFYMKVNEIQMILDKKLFDIIMLNESKLDETIPTKFTDHINYISLRRDRARNGGGILIFIRSEYKVNNVNIHPNIECIYFSIKYNKSLLNFISCYKPPNENDQSFIDKIEEIFFKFDLSNPTFIIGDINIDILNGKNNIILKFIKDNNLKNEITQPTHSILRYNNMTKQSTFSESCIDLLIHNNNLIHSTKIIDCPFSAHKFILANLQLIAEKKQDKYMNMRNLSIANVEKINYLIDNYDFSDIKTISGSNNKWIWLKNILLAIIDSIAPIKKILLKNKRIFPWIDNELNHFKFLRNLSRKQADKSRNDEDVKKKDHYESIYNSLLRTKMINYFKDLKQNDFLNSKKFWEFYSLFTSVKSAKSNESLPDNLFNGDICANSLNEKSDLFNVFFTSLSSNSSSASDECIDFSNNHFKTFLNNNNNSYFDFKKINVSTVQKAFSNVSSTSGPGIADISIKILKNNTYSLLWVFTELFNDCITTGELPCDFKTALVTPLYKKKGNKEDVNNYRGISVIPPAAKAFEKIIADQINEYLSNNNILFENQFGFRVNRSCEQALHEILTRMNRVRNRLLVGLFLFIDFRKAFDLVDALLLLNKLRLYGFSINAINLIKNYFSGRKQKVKIDSTFSQLCDNLLGVPQGSILGPLFFLIFINDLPYYLKKFLSFLFADDTSLFLSDNDLDQLLLEFNKSIDSLITWCYFNRLDINWDKTELMFFTQKREIDFPKSIMIQNKTINVIDQFKLLGIIIDNDFTFLPQVASLRNKINQRLFSIKKIFFLENSVKLQFFKTFILPYFDYCSTLLIYYPKSTIQKIMNSYNFCLFKLFNLKYDINTSDDFNKMNNDLETHGLSSFQHRLIQRFMIFSFNIMNQPDNQLRKQLNFNKDLNKKYNLRNINNLCQPQLAGSNSFDEDTIEYFFYLFINTCCLNDLHLNLSMFKIRTKNNINILFNKFIKTFPKFDLIYK